ncbi:MAG: hypothetical protein EON88_00685 [Brevundimonas sp.]|nr:MAG: hypothetical protein EON88_00685 [Brevundimonas sp.]
MSQFEFFMTFYGLLLGLAVAELLLGFGGLLRARSQPQWGLLTPLLGLIFFIHIMSSFSDAWAKLQGVDIDLVSFGPPALIGVAYFTGALLCAPRDIDDWPSLDEYFHARKRFTLGALVFADVLTIVVLELHNVVHDRPSAIIAYVLINAVWMGLTVAPLFSRSRRLAAGSMTGLLVLMVVLYATPLRIGGLIEAIFGV